MSDSLLWQNAAVFALVDLILVFLLAWRIPSGLFRQLVWPIAISTTIFWSLLWTVVLRVSWDWFYGYIFPGWAPALAPLFGLVYACVGLGLYWLARRLPANPIVVFCLLGGAEGLVSHTWAIYGLGLINQVPLMHGTSPMPVLVFALFEKILYWSIILGMAVLLRYVLQAIPSREKKHASLK